LSGTKSMVLKEFDQTCAAGRTVRPGDNLYFLRNKGECELSVKATVSRVLSFTNQMGEGLSHILKVMQPRLQLTEDQYNDWLLQGRQSGLLKDAWQVETMPQEAIPAAHTPTG
jgi:hypothetical protein